MYPEIYIYIILIGTFGIYSNAYRKYFIEDECTSQKKTQKILYELPPEGSESVGIIQSNRFGTYSRMGRKCLIQLRPPKGYGVLVTILKVDFRNHRDCEDYIEIYNEDKENVDRLCGYQERGPESKTYFSEDDLDIFYNTKEGGMGFYDGFRLVFTVTKIATEQNHCNSQTEFRCANLHCIWSGVTCDGINNCGDASDENTYEHPHCPYVTPAAIAAVVLGMTSFVAILVAVCLCCCRVRHNEEKKNPLIDDFPSRPNGGYLPLPGYTYGFDDPSVTPLQPMHSPQPLPSAPESHQRLGHSRTPLIQQKVELRYERPPPYRE